MRAHLVSWILIAAALTAAAPTFAAGVDPANATSVQREQAQAHFLKGKASFDKNDLPSALEEFRASLEIVASPNARLYVARTLREMGKLVDAYAEFGRTAADAKEHEREDGRYGKAAEAALAERAAIAPQIGFVQLTVHNANDGTTITVGGSLLVRAGWGDPIPVKPGDVEVETLTPGLLPIRKTITIRAGQKMPLDIDAGVASPLVQTPHDTTPAVQNNARASKGWMLPVAIAGGGVGLVGMITFMAAGVASNGTYSDLQKKCGAGPCTDPSLSGEISGGKTQQAVANVGLGFGIVGLVAGGVFLTLWLLPPAKSSTSAALMIGPGSLGIGGTF